MSQCQHKRRLNPKVASFVYLGLIVIIFVVLYANFRQLQNLKQQLEDREARDLILQTTLFRKRASNHIKLMDAVRAAGETIGNKPAAFLERFPCQECLFRSS